MSSKYDQNKTAREIDTATTQEEQIVLTAAELGNSEVMASMHESVAFLAKDGMKPMILSVDHSPK